MAGRANGVAVSSTSVVIARERPDRTAVTFSVGDATNASSVVLKDGPGGSSVATGTNGFPLSASGGLFRVTGKAARAEWSAIRLAAVDCLVGVYEEFLENFAKANAPDEGDPT